jgi:hypothetical protein
MESDRSLLQHRGPTALVRLPPHTASRPKDTLHRTIFFRSVLIYYIITVTG